MNWRTAGKVVFFYGLALLVLSEADSFLWNVIYPLGVGGAEFSTLRYAMLDWTNSFVYRLNLVPWSAAIVVGLALWIGGKKKEG